MVGSAHMPGVALVTSGSPPHSPSATRLRHSHGDGLLRRNSHRPRPVRGWPCLPAAIRRSSTLSPEAYAQVKSPAPSRSLGEPTTALDDTGSRRSLSLADPVNCPPACNSPGRSSVGAGSDGPPTPRMGSPEHGHRSGRPRGLSQENRSEPRIELFDSSPLASLLHLLRDSSKAPPRPPTILPRRQTRRPVDRPSLT